MAATSANSSAPATLSDNSFYNPNYGSIDGDISAAARNFGFNNVLYGQSSNYRYSTSNNFQFNPDLAFHMVHIDKPVPNVPVNLTFYLPIKSRIEKSSGVWFMYLAQAQSLDTITFVCSDNTTLINNTAGAPAQLVYTSDGNPILFLISTPGNNPSYDSRYVIKAIKSPNAVEPKLLSPDQDLTISENPDNTFNLDLGNKRILANPLTINSYIINGVSPELGTSVNATECTNVGYLAGYNNQGDKSVAVGCEAGATSQGNNSVSIGYRAHFDDCNIRSVAIGSQAGQTTASSDSVCIGYQAGQSSLGQGAVIIGAEAGKTLAPANSIIIGRQAASPLTALLSIGNSLEAPAVAAAPVQGNMMPIMYNGTKYWIRLYTALA